MPILHSSIIYDSQEDECLKCPSKYEQTIYTLWNNILGRNITHSTTLMNLKDVMLSEISQSQKPNMVGSIYAMYLNLSNSQKQKVMVIKGRKKGKMGSCLTRYRSSALKDERFASLLHNTEYTQIQLNQFLRLKIVERVRGGKGGILDK
jgi:hypothetical protein